MKLNKSSIIIIIIIYICIFDFLFFSQSFNHQFIITIIEFFVGFCFLEFLARN